MKKSTRLAAMLFAAFILNSQSHAQSPLVTIDTVTVGDAGNAADTTTYGAVTNVFAIGKYEVTIEQYTAFLNSVASVTSDSYIVNLWRANMATDLNIAGISRSGSGVLGDPYSYSVLGSGNRPITYVSWFDAARFANWMNNGATNGASTETGAYTLNGATTGVGFTRNAGASWWIPSENEWYKAAYYKGGGTNAGYWVYPTQSDSAPGNNIGGAANQANYYAGDYAVTQSGEYSSRQNYLTDGGAFSNSGSAYGTFDQAGNVWEWNDAVIGSSRGRRGGAWGSGYGLQSSDRNGSGPAFELNDVGFRVASVPASPAMLVLLGAGSPITNNVTTNSFGGALTNSTTTALTYTIRNTGAAPLNAIAVALAGAGTNQFLLTPPAVQELAPDASTTFAVAFRPQTAGNKTAQLSITSNDANNSPFAVNLQGYGLAVSGDFDGDGLNDAAEFAMQTLGFDWQTAQSSLVDALYSNSIAAGLYTSNNVVTNASFFGLYTQNQFNANRTAGRADVTNKPSDYKLVALTNVPTIRVATKISNTFTVSMPGTWTRYAQSGMPSGWSFNTTNGLLRGKMPRSGVPSVRVTPYRGSVVGAPITIQFQPTAK